MDPIYEVRVALRRVIRAADMHPRYLSTRHGKKARKSLLMKALTPRELRGSNQEQELPGA